MVCLKERMIEENPEQFGRGMMKNMNQKQKSHGKKKGGNDGKER